MDKLRELLEKLGLSKDQIDQILSTDATVVAAVKVPDLISAVATRQKEVLQADDNFLSVIKGNLRGEIIQPRERKALKLLENYVTKEEYEALKPESRLDDLIALGITKIEAAAKKPGNPDDKDKEIGKLREDLRKLTDKVKEYDEVVIPNVRGEVAKKLDGMQTDREIVKLLSTKKLKIGDMDDVLMLVRGKIDERADLVRVDGKTSVRQKGKDLELFENNEKVTLEKLVEDAVKSKGLEIESNPTPPRREPEPGPGDKKSNLPGLNKAKEREDEMKKK